MTEPALSGPRLLVVNADDFGLSAGVNAGILQAARHGIVTSASLMVRAPAAAEAARAVQPRTGLSVGLHLDLAEWMHDGSQWLPLYQVVDTDDAEQVSDEIDRQLASFYRLVGRAPTHIDSHQHVHRVEPVRSLVSALGARLGVPVRGATPGIEYRGDFYGQTGRGEPYREAITVEALCAVIRTLPPGFTELGCHPGYSDGLVSVYALEREAEARVLCEPAVLDEVRGADVKLVSMAAVAC
jgi:predicted glycoside hydrolase/deacetylase ChbG (UPF0249 family)